MPDPAPSRPSLPTSSSDFALPPSSSAATSFASPAFAADDLSPFMLRFRRPSLLAPQVVPEPQRPSPLAASFTPPLARRRHSASASGEESESDPEAKMWTDSPPSGDSGHATPLLPGPPVGAPERDRDASMKPSTSRPRTPPRSSAHSSASTTDMAPEPSSAARAHSRRLSHNVTVPCFVSLFAAHGCLTARTGEGAAHPDAHPRVAPRGERAAVRGAVPAARRVVQLAAAHAARDVRSRALSRGGGRRRAAPRGHAQRRRRARRLRPVCVRRANERREAHDPRAERVWRRPGHAGEPWGDADGCRYALVKRRLSDCIIMAVHAATHVLCCTQQQAKAYVG
ncbi:hypothetical protein AcW1_001250 [Taiwanofungus camphoratus]|nr:hypothetical protein AcW1_001250 [Antrodia cinnamomea]